MPQGSMSHMELGLDSGDDDLLGFLLEESGGLGAARDEALEAPLDWELPLSEALSDWDVEDFLSCLSSPPASLTDFSHSDPYLVHHDHTYSLSQEYVSIDLDNEDYEKEGAQMTSLRVEAPAEQEIGELILTEEEKRLLEKEGLTLPGTLPLTKMEEQVLRRVRRKIRNKKSAQESRRKKKVYVGSLESRVLKYSAQNLELQNKVQLLEEQNLSLLDQLRRLQSMVIQTANKASSSSTCILVLLFSFCLLFVPAMYSSDTRGSPPAEHGGERLETTQEGPGGEARVAPEQSVSPQCCPASFVPSPARTFPSGTCLHCSQRYHRTAQPTSSRLLATLAACSTSWLGLLGQNRP
uniref:BZIP domain-containing protein n=1 Tax=Sus scrofa TaxID=9823 RepID=A0A8D1UQ91_PIG